jgi:indole-3-acetate monooxygenase
MLVPRRYGGIELDAPSAFRAVSALAKLDGSVGWNVAIGQNGSLMPFFASPILCEQIFRDGKDHVIAGSAQPSAFLEDGALPAHGRLPAGAKTPSGSRVLA